MKIKILVLGLTCLFLFGCLGTFDVLMYDISLDEVKRPADAKKRYGEYEIIDTDREGFKYVFEDKMIRIFWLPTSFYFGFLLENKTDHSIRLIWDEAAYVDEDGGSHRIMHSGVRYIERDSPKPPSVIVVNGKLSETIFPTDYISYDGGRYGSGWTKETLLPTSQSASTGSGQKFLEDSQVFVGKTIQVLLPIQIEDVTNDYVFTFKIEDVKLIEKK